MGFGRRLVTAGVALAVATTSLAPVAALADETSDLALARAEMEQAGAELKDYQTSLSMSADELEQIKGEISQVQSQIDQTQAQYDAAKQTLSKRVHDSYREGTESLLDILLGSKTLDEFVSNLYYVASLNRSDVAALNAAKTLSQQLYDQKAVLEAKQAAGEEAQSSSATKANEYQEKVREVQARYNALPEDVKQELANEVRETVTSGGVETDDQGVIQDAVLNVVTTVAQADYSDAVTSGDVSSLADNAAVQAVVQTAVSTTTTDATDAGTASSATTASTTASASSSASSSDTTTATTSSDWLTRAQSVLGTPYVWGGTDSSGLDCSGYVNYVYGSSRGRTTYDMMASSQADGTWSTDFENMQPGDVIITSGGNHVGIYAGDGMMYNSTRPGEGVQLSDLSYFDEVGYIPGDQY